MRKWSTLAPSTYCYYYEDEVNYWYLIETLPPRTIDYYYSLKQLFSCLAFIHILIHPTRIQSSSFQELSIAVIRVAHANIFLSVLGGLT
jgi:hypothetical protein